MHTLREAAADHPLKPIRQTAVEPATDRNFGSIPGEVARFLNDPEGVSLAMTILFTADGLSLGRREVGYEMVRRRTGRKYDIYAFAGGEMAERSAPGRDPRSFLPLTPRAYHVLLALADGPVHGYGVILAVQELTEGVITMRTGTLYVLLRRLLTQRLIEECDDRPGPDEDDERRRYYRLTQLGRSVVEAESIRLHRVVATARRTLGLRRT